MVITVLHSKGAKGVALNDYYSSMEDHRVAGYKQACWSHQRSSKRWGFHKYWRWL